MTNDYVSVPRPTCSHTFWLPGVQYKGETAAQFEAREDVMRAQDAKRAAEMERLWRWKTTPIWELR